MLVRYRAGSPKRRAISLTTAIMAMVKSMRDKKDLPVIDIASDPLRTTGALSVITNEYRLMLACVQTLLIDNRFHTCGNEHRLFVLYGQAIVIETFYTFPGKVQRCSLVLGENYG
jgi:hypothetical protein